MYNEYTTDSLDALYSETQITLIELIKKNNFKIFYFSCKPANDLKISVSDNRVDLNGLDIKIIKKNQEDDFFYFYSQQICQICYSFIKLDKNNNYYFDFMLVVNQNFNLNNFYNFKLKSVLIESVKEIMLNDISFDFIKSLFEQRVLVLNNNILSSDKNFYNLMNLSRDAENYVKNVIKDKVIDYEEFLNINSFYLYKNFDQTLYIKGCFRLLCSQIWSISEFHYKEINSFGLRIAKKDLFNLNRSFLTNFGEISGNVLIEFNSEKINIKNNNYTYCCLMDNIVEQGLFLHSFDVNFNKNQKLNFEYLELHNENFSYTYE